MHGYAYGYENLADDSIAFALPRLIHATAEIFEADVIIIWAAWMFVWVWISCGSRPVTRRPGSARPVEDEGGGSGSCNNVVGTSRRPPGMVGQDSAALR